MIPSSNPQPTRRSLIAAAIAAPLAVAAPNQDWIDLFDGKSLTGWQPSENKASWRVVDGTLAADGPRSHLFYTGPVRGADFKNFEIEVELTTKPECNSGVYFHTQYQETGFPEKGFEIQVNNTAHGDGGYLERKKTASLYGIRNMYKQLVPDNKPFKMIATVRGKNVQIRLNGQLVVDYLEPTPPVIPEGGEKQRFLSHGTFALQCHNDGSKAFFKSVRVRPLPDDLPAYTGPAPVVDETYRDVINIGRHNVPMVDYHVLLRAGMTLDSALRKSRQDGIQYGICTEAITLKNDVEADRWLRPFRNKPVFIALLTKDGEWTRQLSRIAAQQFDYVLAAGQLDEPVEHTVQRLDTEPIDIYAFAEASRVEQRWSEPQMATLIEALVQNKVAIELNSLTQLPSRRFIQIAKEAGCKFAFGTGNQTAAELQRCEFGLHMVQACQLDWRNFYAPGSWWPKAVERRWPSRKPEKRTGAV
jgi:hypothetical protein